MTKKGLRFSPKAHRYWLDGKPVRGVTTVLNVLNKPALVSWAAKSVAEYVADNPDGVEVLRQMGREPMINALKSTPYQIRDEAAKRGTELHLYAEELVRGESVSLDDNDPLLPVTENAVMFLEEWQIDPILVEAPVGSRQHWYAGTADLFANYVHPVTGEKGAAIFDWKSAKSIYAEAAYQLTAYRYAEFTGLGGVEQALPSVDKAFGVHIRADGYDVHQLKSDLEVYEEFLHILACFDAKKRAEGNWRVPGSGYVGAASENVVKTVEEML